MAQKLMVSGFVCSHPGCALTTEIRRGMPVQSNQGIEVGKVTAVVLDDNHETATHLIFDRLPGQPGYWMVPVELIAAANGDHLTLSIPNSAIEALPVWHPD